MKIFALLESSHDLQHTERTCVVTVYAIRTSACDTNNQRNIFNWWQRPRGYQPALFARVNETSLCTSVRCQLVMTGKSGLLAVSRASHIQIRVFYSTTSNKQLCWCTCMHFQHQTKYKSRHEPFLELGQLCVT